jgi:hypothetical protein
MPWLRFRYCHYWLLLPYSHYFHYAAIFDAIISPFTPFSFLPLDITPFID